MSSHICRGENYHLSGTFSQRVHQRQGAFDKGCPECAQLRIIIQFQWSSHYRAYCLAAEIGQTVGEAPSIDIVENVHRIQIVRKANDLGSGTEDHNFALGTAWIVSFYLCLHKRPFSGNGFRYQIHYRLAV